MFAHSVWGRCLHNFLSLPFDQLGLGVFQTVSNAKSLKPVKSIVLVGRQVWCIVFIDVCWYSRAELRTDSPRQARACNAKCLRKEQAQSQRRGSESRLTTQAHTFWPTRSCCWGRMLPCFCALWSRESMSASVQVGWMTLSLNESLTPLEIAGSPWSFRLENQLRLCTQQTHLPSFAPWSLIKDDLKAYHCYTPVI